MSLNDLQKNQEVNTKLGLKCTYCADWEKENQMKYPDYTIHQHKVKQKIGNNMQSTLSIGLYSILNFYQALKTIHTSSILLYISANLAVKYCKSLV